MKKLNPMLMTAINLLIASFLILGHQVVQAQTIHCGQKSIMVENGKLVRITHEDGTVHSGNSVSDNWAFDGKTLKHRLINEKIKCSNKSKSRNEVIDDLSSNFTKNPSIYNMDTEEARWMKAYTAKLMRTDKSCHLVSDASKSSDRKNMYFIDCNDKSGNPNRYWVSRDDLKSGNQKQAVTPISKSKAIELCNSELKAQVTNPSTYDPSLLIGTTSRTVQATGRNVVEIEFKAANKLGAKGKFRGTCILESGNVIEASIAEI